MMWFVLQLQLKNNTTLYTIKTKSITNTRLDSYSEKEVHTPIIRLGINTVSQSEVVPEGGYIKSSPPPREVPYYKESSDKESNTGIIIIILFMITLFYSSKTYSISGLFSTIWSY